MHLHKILLCAAIFLLSACGPQMRTDYELIQPPTQNGRYCANNCLGMKQACTQTCYGQRQQCQQLNAINETNDRIQARIEYDDYVHERTRKGQKIKRDESYFRSNNSLDCDNDYCIAQCEGTFNMCYSNCGGKVIPHTYCTANCEDLPQRKVFIPQYSR